MVTKLSRFTAAIALVLCAGHAIAESFQAGTPTREVGPFIAAQASPSPTPGGWQSSDDRLLGSSINGQGGWQTLTFSARYDEEIAVGQGHSGGHAWRLSNWFHTGLVNPILSPSFAPVGEAGSGTGFGGTGNLAQSNHAVYEFWFRTASTNAEPGTFVSTTISDAPGRRMTYLGFFDELPGAGTSPGNGCPDDNGCFHVDAVDVTKGIDTTGPSDAVFQDHYSPAPLVRGAWYRARIDAHFVSGPGVFDAGCNCHLGNDQIHYQVFDAFGATALDVTIGSWEAAYFDARYGSPSGDTVASDHIAFRVSANADNGSQAPFDTNSVANQPHGLYFDDVSVVPDSGTGLTTGFEFDRYVATTGHDSGDCSNPLQPCLTVRYAITQANAYDQINVAAGTYAENSGGGENLLIDKPVVIRGVQAGIDARTRSDAGATIIVPGVADANISVDSLGESYVADVQARGVTIDGVILDGFNPNMPSLLNLNGAHPNADTGVLAVSGGLTLQNVVLRNLGGSGLFGYATTQALGDNLVRYNRFENIAAPSSWGRAILLYNDYYASVTDNLFNDVRMGVYTENHNQANPGTVPALIARNEIHASRTGIWHNLFGSAASTFTIADNSIVAVANANETRQWSGIWIESMQGTQTVVMHNNQIDGSAVTGTNRNTVGYLLNNLNSSLSGSTDLDDGAGSGHSSVGGVDVGVLATDQTVYGGPVNDVLIRNLAFSDIALGAIYVEDTNEEPTSAKVTVGTGNSFINAAHQLVLSGTAPHVGFNGTFTGFSDVLVRSQRNYFYAANSTYAPCNVTLCTVKNASINAGIAAAGVGATVAVENGTFDEVVTIARNDLLLTSSDNAHPATLTRLSGGPTQSIVIVNAAKNIQISNLDFTVDKTFAGEGIVAGGFVDGLSIHDNQFTQIWSDNTHAAAFAITNAISINVSGNSSNLARVDGANVSIQNNTIAGSTSPHATGFRAGVAMDAGVGAIQNNTINSVSHDVIVRFADAVGASTSNVVAISDNQLLGGGLDFASPNSANLSVSIDHNTISAAAGSPALTQDQTVVEADIALVRLIGNQAHLPVSMSHNQFSGYAQGYRGVLVENFPNLSVTDNVFTPLAGAGDFVSLVVSNKELTTPTAAPPMTLNVTALRNQFNGSGTAGAGRAVEFIDDNDANGTATFGALLFGSSQVADANSFDGNHGLYFQLDDDFCDTRVPVGSVPPQCIFLNYNGVGNLTDTQVRPFRGNVQAANNLFAGTAPAAMSPSQRSALNAQTHDVNDNGALGLVDYGLSTGVVLRLDGPLTNVQVGVPAIFSGEITNTGAAITENSVVHLVLGSDRTGGIQASDITAEYDAGGGYQPLPLTASAGALSVDFGGAGFAIPQGYHATTLFRFAYNYAAATTTHYAIAATVHGMSSGNDYAADTHATQVVQSAANIALTLSGPQTANAGDTVSGYSARIVNAGGATPENVLVHFVVSRPGGLNSGDIDVQFDAGSGNFFSIPLSTCNTTALCGTFGPQPAGFAVGVGYDHSTPLRVIYHKSGAISVGVSVDGLSNTQYATAALLVNVSAGAATTIAANGTTSFAGTAGAALATPPSVIATDAYGDPVAGVSVTFAAGPSSGSVTGAVQTTGSDGIAMLGGWTLSADPSASNSVSASATVANGSPVTFTATGAAHYDISATIDTARAYAQTGHTIDYVITVHNAGPSDASGIIVTDVLPAELNAAATTWHCFGSGVTCTASGSGDIHDIGVTIPASGSAVYLLSSSVLNAGLSDVVVNMATVSAAADTDSTNNSASASTVVVIFRDGFETGGDGAQASSAAFAAVAVLDAGGNLILDDATSPAAGFMPQTWVRIRDADAREVLRIDVIDDGSNLRLRLVSIDEHGSETRGDWIAVTAGNAHVTLSLAGSLQTQTLNALVDGSSTAAKIVLPAGVRLPLTVYGRD